MNLNTCKLRSVLDRLTHEELTEMLLHYLIATSRPLTSGAHVDDVVNRFFVDAYTYYDHEIYDAYVELMYDEDPDMCACLASIVYSDVETMAQ